MEVFVGVTVVLVLAVFALLVWRRLAMRPKARPMPAAATGVGAEVVRNVENQVGYSNITLPDIFTFEVGAYLIDGIVKNHIAGRVTYREGGYTWMEYYLTDATWLGADKDDGDRLINWERVIPSDMEPTGKKPLVFKGVKYEFVERGAATYQADGRVGDLTGTGAVEYADYSTSDGQYHLSFERYDDDDDWEMAIGETVVLATLEYYPPGLPV